jgi:glycosyltransferase involved in cell wall biosynthesis
MDGGSTDGTLKIANEYKHYFPKIDWVIKSEPDRGEPDAINKGLKLATGDIVAWLDADDYYDDSCFAYVLSILSTEPDVDWIHGRYQIVDELDHPILNWMARAKTILQYLNSRMILKCVDYIPQPSVFMRRSSLPGELSLDKYCFDYDYWLRFKTMPVFIPQILSYWRRHGDSISVVGAKLEAAQAYSVARKYGRGIIYGLAQKLVYLLTLRIYR